MTGRESPPPSGESLHGWHDLLRPAGLIAFSRVMAEDSSWDAVFTAVDAFLPPGKVWASCPTALVARRGRGPAAPGHEAPSP